MASLSALTDTYIDTCMHTYTRTCIHTYICTYICTCMHAHIHTYTYTYTRKHARARAHTHTHMDTQVAQLLTCNLRGDVTGPYVGDVARLLPALKAPASKL